MRSFLLGSLVVVTLFSLFTPSLCELKTVTTVYNDGTNNMFANYLVEIEYENEISYADVEAIVTIPKDEEDALEVCHEVSTYTERTRENTYKLSIAASVLFHWKENTRTVPVNVTYAISPPDVEGTVLETQIFRPSGFKYKEYSQLNGLAVSTMNPTRSTYSSTISSNLCSFYRVESARDFSVFTRYDDGELFKAKLSSVRIDTEIEGIDKFPNTSVVIQ